MTGTLVFLRSNEESRVDQAATSHLEFLTLDASRRSIMVKADGTFCSEPVPDLANSFAKEFATKVAGSIANEKAAASLKQVMSTDLTKLFERSQGIQALRDGMYRLCEAFLNKAIPTQAYQDHMSDLTATLNFIVPLELCAKLNREVVASLASMPPISVSDSKKVAGRAEAPSSPVPGDTNKISSSTVSETAEKQWRLEWGATIANSELLTSKFTQACMELGSQFASRLAGTMATRTNSRVFAQSSFTTPPPPSSETSRRTAPPPISPSDPYAATLPAN